MSSRVLSETGWRGDIERVEREHPELIVRDGDNIVLAHEAGATARLAYSFVREPEFGARFADMFGRLLPRLRRTLDADRARFRLAHPPARPVVEPVLKKLWFSPARDWIAFEFAAGRQLPKGGTVRGVTFRDAARADLEAIARIDDEAFPRAPVPLHALRGLLADGAHGCLVAIARGELVGFCLYFTGDSERPHINDLAVSGGERGRGIGTALTVRALKRLFARGARAVTLTTDEDNASAIRLYMRLGFRQHAAGRDYTRPLDPTEIARLERENRGTLIKFGGWR